MFWGKTMGQETSEPVWHSCSMSPAGTAGARYFAGYSLAQAKVSWHFFTSPVVQLLEKLCQGPECINGPLLLWPTSPGAPTHTFCSGAPLQLSPCPSYAVNVPVSRSSCIAVMPGHASCWPGWILTCGLCSWFDIGPALSVWTCLVIMRMGMTLATTVRLGLTLAWWFACQAWLWTYLVTTNCLGLQEASCLRGARL